jgi:hypothetical protein
MPGTQCDSDFAVSLEPADPGTMTGAWVNDNERPAGQINLDTFGRNNPDEYIVHWPLKGMTVYDNFERVVQDVRGLVGRVLAILIASFAQHVKEQNSALGRVDRVFDRGT